MINHIQIKENITINGITVFVWAIYTISNSHETRCYAKTDKGSILISEKDNIIFP